MCAGIDRLLSEQRQVRALARGNPPLLTFDSGANKIVELPYIDGPANQKKPLTGALKPMEVITIIM
jgi:hypothetical protein